jgi:ParB-like chromosome segregation protein Spo0J
MKKRGAVAEQSPLGGIAVPKTTLVALSAVKFAPYNPRVMSKEQRRALKASLLKHGMVLNLVVQRESAAYGAMVLIGGHQRVDVMRELCAEKGWAEPTDLPAVVLDVPDATAKQLNVTLNNVEGDFDPDKLGLLFADIRLDLSADDIVATGFDQTDIDELIRLSAPPDDLAAALEAEAAAISPVAGAHTLTIDFATEAAKVEAKELLRAMAGERRERAGDVVLRLARAQRSANKSRPSQPPKKGKKQAA